MQAPLYRTFLQSTIQSQALEVHSILVSGLSEEDLRLGMEMGAIAGQLAVAADVAAMLDLPVLAEFLADKGMICGIWPSMRRPRRPPERSHPCCEMQQPPDR